MTLKCTDQSGEHQGKSRLTLFNHMNVPFSTPHIPAVRQPADLPRLQAWRRIQTQFQGGDKHISRLGRNNPLQPAWLQERTRGVHGRETAEGRQCRAVRYRELGKHAWAGAEEADQLHIPGRRRRGQLQQEDGAARAVHRGTRPGPDHRGHAAALGGHKPFPTNYTGYLKLGLAGNAARVSNAIDIQGQQIENTPKEWGAFVAAAAAQAKKANSKITILVGLTLVPKTYSSTNPISSQQLVDAYCQERSYNGYWLNIAAGTANNPLKLLRQVLADNGNGCPTGWPQSASARIGYLATASRIPRLGSASWSSIPNSSGCPVIVIELMEVNVVPTSRVAVHESGSQRVPGFTSVIGGGTSVVTQQFQSTRNQYTLRPFTQVDRRTLYKVELWGPLLGTCQPVRADDWAAPLAGYFSSSLWDPGWVPPWS
jgi:hypothetical protein